MPPQPFTTLPPLFLESMRVVSKLKYPAITKSCPESEKFEGLLSVVCITTTLSTLTGHQLLRGGLRQLTHFDSFEIEHLGRLATDGKTYLEHN